MHMIPQYMSPHVPVVLYETFLKKMIGDSRFPRVKYPIILGCLSY